MVVVMSTVEVVVASPKERIVFENLMQLYTHDFSEHWYDRPIGEVDHEGRFPPYALDPYNADRLWTISERMLAEGAP